MKSNKLILLMAAFLICFFAIGIPYWQIPYSNVSLPGSLYEIGLLLVIVGALAFCLFGLGFLWSAVSFGSVAPAVVSTRIIMDTARDGSTHNLFPFEIAIAVFVGFSAAAFGALTGSLIRNLLHRHNDHPEV